MEPEVKEVTDDQVATLAAAHCINARGAVAHCKPTERSCSSADSLQGAGNGKRAACSIFDQKGGGTKILDSIESICEELLKHGPVVSTSFVLDEAFAAKHAGSFAEARIGKNHETVIVGWKQTEDGEFWTVKAPLTGTMDDGVSNGGMISIPVRQFGIDGVCWAPKSTFKSLIWQDGPYWNQSLSSSTKKEWYSHHPRTFSCTGEGLKNLAKCLGVGCFPVASKNKTRFVIRDTSENAISRACRLTNVEWKEETERWIVSVSFTDALV